MWDKDSEIFLTNISWMLFFFVPILLFALAHISPQIIKSVFVLFKSLLQSLNESLFGDILIMQKKIELLHMILLKYYYIVPRIYTTILR